LQWHTTQDRIGHYVTRKKRFNSKPLHPFVTASARPLIRLTYSDRSQEILSSPFFNIFAALFLGLMPEDEARQLIREPIDGALSAETEDFIYDLVGGHPLGLQIACFHALDTPEDTAEIERETMRELGPHFQYYWHNLTNDEQYTVRQLNDAITRAPSDTTLRGCRQCPGLCPRTGVGASRRQAPQYTPAKGYPHPRAHRLWHPKILSSDTAATKTGMMMGTLDYMAPEQIRVSKEVDGRADVYALGVMLYHMLSGELPFKGDHPSAVMLGHLQEPAPDPRDLIPGLPDTVAEAILSALAKDPDERPVSPGDLAKAIGCVSL
jgi:serine/threonine protein kinase